MAMVEIPSFPIYFRASPTICIPHRSYTSTPVLHRGWGIHIGFVATLHVSVDPLCFFPDCEVEEERYDRFQGEPI
jgi:hypothetical protein